MENKYTTKRFIPYLVAGIIFLIINLIYFSPQFRGETLRQHDVVQYSGMTQDILEHRAEYGEDPQWEGRMFGGMPAYLINMEYGGALIKSLSKAMMFMGQPAALIFIAMCMFFCMLLCLGINPWIGIIPSLAYGLSTYFFIIIGAGHITKMVALAFVPMLLGSIFMAYRKNMWLGVSLAALFASIQIAASHPQISYYFIFIILAFWINELISAYKAKLLPRFAKVTGWLALAAVLAVGSNASMLYYTNSHTEDTIRGGSELSTASQQEGDKGLSLEYATSWSYGKAETFNLLIPNLYGGTSEGGFASDGEVANSLSKYNARNIATSLPAYWGQQPITSGPVYIGAVIIFLAILGMFILCGREKWWLVVVSIFAIMLAWGSNMIWFTELMFNYFPLYNKFRTVSMILVIVEWTIPFLAALTLQKLWHGEVEKPKMVKALKWTTIIVGGIAAIFMVGSSALFSFTGASDGSLPADVVAAMQSERASMLRADALRTIMFTLLTAATVWLFYKQSLKKWIFVATLGVLVTVDLVPVNLRYLNDDKFAPKQKNIIAPTEADKQILTDKELGFRVINLSVSPFNDATTSYFHRSIGGYHGAKLRRYQDIIEHHLSKMNWGVYDMLNTKYIISANEQGVLDLQVNPSSNGAAWFVSKIVVVDSPDAEIGALDSLDTKHAAVIDRQFEDKITEMIPNLNIPADSSSTIEMSEYRVNLQQYKYSASAPGVAVFSEIYYPKGWSAYIDGVEAPYFRANYILRAMVLPAGEHTVEFRFSAPDYSTLSAITLICSLLLLAGVAAAFINFLRKR